MKKGTSYLSNDLKAWCRLVIDSFKPVNVLFFGNEYTEVVQDLSELQVEAYGIDVDYTTAQVTLINTDGSPVINNIHKTWGLLIISHSAFESQKVFPFHTLSGLVQSSNTVLLVLFSDSSTDLPLPVVSKWLRDSGYIRDYRVEMWVADRIFTCTFVPKEVSCDDIIQNQEMEWWRLALLNQKRRLVQQEYMQELIPANWRISVLEHDLTVYHNSRTAKTIRALQKIRQMFRLSSRRS